MTIGQKLFFAYVVKPGLLKGLLGEVEGDLWAAVGAHAAAALRESDAAVHVGDGDGRARRGRGPGCCRDDGSGGSHRSTNRITFMDPLS